MPLAERFAAYAHALAYPDIPAPTLHEAKRRVLDTLGCALGALDSPPAGASRRVALTSRSSRPATLIGAGAITSPDMAAFANGVLFRYLDYNDTYLSLEPAHPSDNIAAVLAAAEAAGAGGREVLTAIVLAYEIQCRLCDAAGIRARGWDHTTYGAFSTSLAAGKLLGLRQDQLLHALSIAITIGAALRQTRVGALSNWKGCAFAAASRNGLFAAMLAAEGMTGPSDIVEGERGFWKQVSGPFEVAELGGDGFMIDRTYIKFYPAEYHSQSAIDAALEIRAELRPGERPEAVRIETFDAALQIIGGEPEKFRPTTRETADHSLPYCVAAALLDGRVTLHSFDEDHLRSEALLSLAAGTRVVESAELSARYPEGIPNRVRVTTSLRRTLEREVTYPRGHARNPLPDEDVERKFRALASGVIPDEAAAGIARRCWDLENETDLPGLLALLTPPGRGGEAPG